MDLNFFQSQVIYMSNDAKSNAFRKYTNDYSQTHYLFTMRNNSLIYYNKNQNLTKAIDEYRSLIVLNTLFSLKDSVIILYSNGDLITIPIAYIENDLFANTWTKLASIKGNKNINSKATFNNFIMKNSLSGNKAPILSQFLLCGSGITSTLLQSMSGLAFKNVYEDYLGKCQSSKERGTFASLELWLNKKIEYLIIAIDCWILVIDMVSMECVVKHSISESIYSMLLFGIIGTFEFLIIQTEAEYYTLTLFDCDSDINVLNKDYNNTSDNSLFVKLTSLCPNSILSIQYYNKEKVLCSLTQMNSFEIFNIYDMTKPMFSINLTNPSFIKPRSELINCFLYEKMLITITKLDSVYYISLIHYWIGNDNNSNKCFTSFPNQMVFNERVWCNINYSLLDDNIILTKKLDSKIVFSTVNIKSSPLHSNATNQFSVYILTKGSLIAFSPIINNLIITSINKELKDSFNYNTLRKLELFNNGLKGLIFEYNDILTNELCKERELMIKLLWFSSSSSNEFISNILKDIIDNICTNGNKMTIKNMFEFKNDIIDYLLFNLTNQRGSINMLYCEFLCKLYIDYVIKKEYCEKVYEMMIGKAKLLTSYYFGKEYALNNNHKTTNNYDEVFTSSSSSNIEESNTNTSNELGLGNLRKPNKVLEEVTYAELGVSKRLKQRIFNDNDKNTINDDIPNTIFSYLKPSKDKSAFITSPLPTVFTRKILFEKVLAIAFFSNDNEDYQYNKFDNTVNSINIHLNNSITASVLNAKDYLSHIKLFLAFITLDNAISISDRMIEEVLIIKLTSPSKSIEKLIHFLSKFYISSTIITDNTLLLNSFSLIQSSTTYAEYIKDSQVLSKEAINSYFTKTIAKFLFENNKNSNKETTQLKTVFSIVFLVYYYKAIVINKDNSIDNQTIVALKNLLKILIESNERKNKYLSKYINELRLSIYPQPQSYNYSSYYETILLEMKIKKQHLTNNTLTINELIEENTSDLFKQNVLLKYFKNTKC